MGDGLVGEAIASGLERQTIRNSVAGAVWVQAYRLKDQPADMSPVLDKANEYLDQGPRYGYEQLLLLAFLGMTRKLKITPSLNVLIRRVLESRGMDYWESGMDMKLGDDIHDSFRAYQRQLLKEYQALAEEFGFLVLDARKRVDVIQRELRRTVSQFLEVSDVPSMGPLAGP